MPYTVFEGAGPSICYGDRKGPDRAKPSKVRNPSDDGRGLAAHWPGVDCRDQPLAGHGRAGDRHQRADFGKQDCTPVHNRLGFSEPKILAMGRAAGLKARRLKGLESSASGAPARCATGPANLNSPPNRRVRVTGRAARVTRSKRPVSESVRNPGPTAPGRVQVVPTHFRV